jgi:hypothetical protein
MVHSLTTTSKDTARKPELAGQKARIHSGAVAGKQPGFAIPGMGCQVSDAKYLMDPDLRTLTKRNRGLSMGRYIDDILQPGEKVLYSTNAHWIFYFPAIVAGVVAVILLILSRATASEGITLLCLSAAAVAALAALYWTVKGWFHRWTTETDVTNMRVVHKVGFIKRRTFEMSLDKVESVDVNQSILGRLLNYGDVTILGVGEGKETIRMIASPLAFRSFITAREEQRA